MALEVIYDGATGAIIETKETSDNRPQFKTLTGSAFIALMGSVLGFARMDELLAKSKTVETLLVKAVTVDRLTGNTPSAIAFLQTGANALTNEELAAIDAAWEQIS